MYISGNNSDNNNSFPVIVALEDGSTFTDASSTYNWDNSYPGNQLNESNGSLSLGGAAGADCTTVTGDLKVTGAINGSITSGGFTSLGDAPATTINSVASVTFGYRSASHNGTMWIQLPSGSTTTSNTEATIGGTAINIGTTNIGIRLSGVDYLIPFTTSGSNRFATTWY